MADDGTSQVTNLFGLDLISQDSGSEVRTLLVDGLGSVWQEMAGSVVETATTYSPYGKVLEQTGASGTVYGFTGEQEDSATGLLYLRARYYNVSLKVFQSQDPWEGSGRRPGTLNYYVYVLNNPVRFRDPTGHCAVGDTACWALADELYAQYGWYMVGLGSQGRWTLDELQILWDAAAAIEFWFADHGGGDARGRMRAALGGTQFTKAGIVGNLVLQGKHHVRGSKVHLLPNFIIDEVVHETAHVLDNRLGLDPWMTALHGGGPADDMAYELGFDPSVCLQLTLYVSFSYPRLRIDETTRSICPSYTLAANRKQLREEPPSKYAKSGPSEDFAETFMLSVLNPLDLGPIRTAFMINLAHSLTTIEGEFQGSPYTALQRSGQGYITCGGNILTPNWNFFR